MFQCCLIRYVIISFFVPFLVDCRWSEWVVGECSVTCGVGKQPKYREMVQEHLFGGVPCTGLATELQECVGESGENCPGNIL